MNQRIVMVKEKWTTLGTGWKIGIGTGLLALLFFLFFMFFMPSPYKVLYSGLDEKDVKNIEKYLSSNSIEYQLNAENNEISVDGNIIQIKKDLALEGLPSGGTSGGLEQFSNMSLGSTKYDKDVQYQNALQDELSNSLSTMFEGISSADVKLPLQEEESIFSENNSDKTISVALKLRSGYELTPQQVKAVQVYVSGALNNVLPENVQVVDQDLNPLSSGDVETSQSSVEKQQEIVTKTKKKLESELEEALSEVYGRVKVIVNLEINFDEIVSNITKYDPAGTLVSREEETERIRDVSGGEESTTIGTDENGEVPRYELEDEGQAEILSAEDRDHIIENFVVGETVEKIIKSPELRNTNISVWFDDVTLNQNDIYDAEELVAVASGLKGAANRVVNDKAIYENGSVKVIKKAFATDTQKTEEVTQPEEEKSIFSEIPWYIYLIGSLLLLAIIAAIIFLIIRRNKKKEQMELEEEEMLESAISDEDRNDREAIGELENENLEQEFYETIGGKFDLELNEAQQNLRKLTNEVAKKYPKETADVISKIMKK